MIGPPVPSGQSAPLRQGAAASMREDGGSVPDGAVPDPGAPRPSPQASQPDPGRDRDPASAGRPARPRAGAPDEGPRRTGSAARRAEGGGARAATADPGPGRRRDESRQAPRDAAPSRPREGGPEEARIAPFLARAGWGGATRAPLAGDASGRRYERLARGGSTAVLMIAPPGAAASVRAFAEVGARLSSLGLSPPEPIAAEPEAGLMLLEDLGDALLARVVARRPSREPALYAAAAEVLAVLRAAGPPEGLPLYDADAMAEATALAAPWYARAEDAPWVEPLRAALERHAGPPDALILRDYHAENLVWLPERRGPARLGLLDFQDAMRGPAAYDLASLIRDARRDVSPAAAAAATARFAKAAGTPPAALDAALAVLGAQRALRILGVFARLARRDGRPRYLALLPRVWAQLAADLAHPALAAARGPALGALPPPGPAWVEGLRCRP